MDQCLSRRRARSPIHDGNDIDSSSIDVRTWERRSAPGRAPVIDAFRV